MYLLTASIFRVEAHEAYHARECHSPVAAYLDVSGNVRLALEHDIEARIGDDVADRSVCGELVVDEDLIEVCYFENILKSSGDVETNPGPHT